ncbi:MAG: FkbM family methyltransferase [Chitinophagaceae bacterium]|nr:FkbM family methyltransferase [Chitinophagaceae bacterium]
MPDVFEQLKENSSFASGRLIFENSAISDTGGEFTLYYIDNSEKKFPEWVSQLTSFNKDVLQKNLTYYPEYARHISEKKIQSLSFSALLKKHGVTTVDLVSIDTEGFDYEILKTIDFGVTRPSLIIFEVSHLSKEQFKKGVSLLKKHNYAVAITAKDCIAYSKVPGPGQTTG